MSAVNPTMSPVSEIDSHEHVACYHCGQAVPSDDYLCDINGVTHAMCCAGCKGVTEMIIELGLDNYYNKRTAKALRPDQIIPNKIKDLESYKLESIEKLVCDELDADTLSTELLIRGITCPACCWLCESRLSMLDGVQAVSINYTTHRLKISWNKHQVDLDRIIQVICKIGFDAKIYNKHSELEYREQTRKKYLQSLGLTAVLGMQVMMISIALYFGEHSGMEAFYIELFCWINMALTTPVMFISARPFFQNALRDLRMHNVSMDLAVSLGLGLAYLASIVATMTGKGEVYFDTIVMFIFFLSAGRYVEFMLRQKSLYQTQLSEFQLPLSARKINAQTGVEEIVAATDLKQGDHLLIKPGEVIPADGFIYEGATDVNESMLTGESKPVSKNNNDKIISGSVNISSIIKMQVTATGKETVMASIENMIQQAQNEKPVLNKISDKVASYFISAVILVALIIIFSSGVTNVDNWLSTVIAVLIVCCPCALSLAMPTAYSSAIGRLSKEGIIFKNIDRLLSLDRLRHFIFDKTGTATTGKFSIVKVKTCSELSKEKCMAIAAAMEKFSEHPIARAFDNINVEEPGVKDIKNYSGLGLSAKINNQQYYLGNRDFIFSQCDCKQVVNNIGDESSRTLVYLAGKTKLLAVFMLEDIPRDNLDELIKQLKSKQIKTYLCSGDNKETTRKVANDAGFDEYHANMLPKDKLKFMQSLKNKNNSVAMIGDGINDAPTLATADISFSFSEGSDLAQLEADAVLLKPDVNNINASIAIASLCKKVIKQNIAWAISYNVIALPIAISGLLAPWMAAIGMSLSSLIVVLNADRVRKYKTT